MIHNTIGTRDSIHFRVKQKYVAVLAQQCALMHLQLPQRAQGHDSRHHCCMQVPLSLILNNCIVSIYMRWLFNRVSGP